MNEGIVKFFNQTKGFGFIREENSGTEYFVHATGLIDKVRENDRVATTAHHRPSGRFFFGTKWPNSPLKDLKISLLNAKIRPSKSLYLPSLKEFVEPNEPPPNAPKCDQTKRTLPRPPTA
jgi:cold shock CspA family protein